MDKKEFRREFNNIGGILVAQMSIFYLISIILMALFLVVHLLTESVNGEYNIDTILNSITSNGLIYIIPVIIAFIPVLLFRKEKFFNYDLKVVNKKINFMTVICSICIIIALNFLTGYLYTFLEWLLNLVGLTAEAGLEAIGPSNTITMLLYSCIVAPFFEEFLFRGAVLRYLEKYGKRFAIIASSILFGLMHGNLVQALGAIIVGLFLGYLACEYSIKLSIIAHMANNVFAEIYNNVSTVVNESTMTIIYLIIMIVTIIVTIAVCIGKRKSIKEWFVNSKSVKGSMTYFCTSLTILLIICFDLFMCILSISRIV